MPLPRITSAVLVILVCVTFTPQLRSQTWTNSGSFGQFLFGQGPQVYSPSYSLHLLFGSTDYGTTWSDTNGLFHNFDARTRGEDVWFVVSGFVHSDTLYIAAVRNVLWHNVNYFTGGLFYYTRQTRRVPMSSDTSSAAIIAIAKCEGERLVAVSTDSRLLVSTNFGRTWQRGDSLPIPTREYSIVRWVFPYKNCLVTDGDRHVVIATSKGARLSTDAGRSWRVAGDTTMGAGLSAAIRDSSRFAVAGYSLHLTTDGGETWREYAPSPTVGRIRALEFRDPTNIVVGSDSGIFMLNTDSEMWSRQVLPTKGRRIADLKRLTNTRFIATRDGTNEILYTDDLSDVPDEPLQGVRLDVLVDGRLLIIDHADGFRPRLLALYDLYGREVWNERTSSMDRAGSRVEVDISGLPSGAYIVRACDPDGICHHRRVLISR